MGKGLFREEKVNVDEFEGMQEFDFEDEFEDDEDDELYRPKKCNGVKSLAPFFISEIGRIHSSKTKKLKVQDVVNLLAEMPYEVTMDRKAVGRIIHSMADTGLGFQYSQKQGFWYDCDTIWSY